MYNNLIVRSLCWYQPFASLMLHGKIETRMWKNNSYVRGKILICSTNIPFNDFDLFNLVGKNKLSRIIDTLKKDPSRKLNGYAIAIGDYVNFRPMKLKDEEMAFIPYSKKRKCLIFKNVKRIKPFILSKEFRGQSFRILDEEQKSKIKILSK